MIDQDKLNKLIKDVNQERSTVLYNAEMNGCYDTRPIDEKYDNILYGIKLVSKLFNKES